MQTALWAVVAAAALLWPARLAGPLDGVPLDSPLEALIIGGAAPWLILSHGHVLRASSTRVLTVALLAWKAFTAVSVTPDGWCVRFETAQPLYRDMGLVPHAWDVRADWRAPDPRCSAVMTRSYASIEQFPVWFFNLPPADHQPAQPSDRPPEARISMRTSGTLNTVETGRLHVAVGVDMRARVLVDGTDRSTEAMAEGIPIEPGLHEVVVDAELAGDQWRLRPTWNDQDVWTATTATMEAPTAFDEWVRPWGRAVPAVLVVFLTGLWLVALVRSVGIGIVPAWSAVVSIAVAAVTTSGAGARARGAPLLMMLPLLRPVTRRARSLQAFALLVGAPWLVLVGVLGMPQVGAVTLYTSGDDWWMFQRYAYRIFLQGYWIEGGQPTFWFQPFYRWIAGALHLVFGDSSVGELFWDAGCALTGASFAFVSARALAGARWGFAAAVVTLAVLTLGPAWCLFGRGLSELSSAGFIYAAALFALRGRSGHWPYILAAGACATLAFYTRLNNLPMAVAVSAFALPLRQDMAGVWRAEVWRRLSPRVALGVIGTIAIGILLFATRTYYYTGIWSIFHGTQAAALSVWQTTPDGLSPLQNVTSSVLMVLSMNDPPRFDPRAVPVVAGVAAAVLGACGVPPFRRLPLNLCGLCLAGLSGALVARGTAYPGRFSVHLVPVAVALATCVVAQLVQRCRGAMHA